jgi:Uma2 family endonuclease
MIALAEEKTETIGDLVRRLGDISTDRILLTPMPGKATEADVIRFLESSQKRLFELINGVLVEKPVGYPESVLASYICGEIWQFIKSKKTGGKVSGADGAVRMWLGLVLIPDVCFVSAKRLSENRLPKDQVSKIIPDLAVEVLSPSNTVAEIELKLDHYFEAGVRLVWIIDPNVEKADVYTSRRRMKHFDAAGTLDGGKVMPGFKLSLAELFAIVNPKD